MKMIDLGFGAVAIEPDPSARDKVSDLDVSALRHVGVSEKAIRIYERFGLGLDGGPASGQAHESAPASVDPSAMSSDR